MTFQEVLAAVRARWYAAVAVLLCVAAAGYVVLRAKPLYQATAAVALVPPRAPSVPNTLAAATPSLAAVGIAVDDVLTGAAEVESLRARGVSDPFSIAPRNNGTSETPAYRVPSELITVTGENPATVVREAGILVLAYTEGLGTMQANAGVVAKARITDATLAPPTAIRLHGSRSRGAVGIAILALGAAIAVAVRLRRGGLPDTGQLDQDTNTEDVDAVIG